MGEVVKITKFAEASVRLYPNYAETKDYFAISALFVDADVVLRLKITKDDNPLAYKISDTYLKSLGEIVTIYFVENELIAIESVQ